MAVKDPIERAKMFMKVRDDLKEDFLEHREEELEEIRKRSHGDIFADFLEALTNGLLDMSEEELMLFYKLSMTSNLIDWFEKYFGEDDSDSDSDVALTLTSLGLEMAAFGLSNMCELKGGKPLEEVIEGTLFG